MSFADEVRSVQKSLEISDEFIFAKADEIIEEAVQVYLTCIKYRIKEKAREIQSGCISGNVNLVDCNTGWVLCEETHLKDFNIRNLTRTPHGSASFSNSVAMNTVNSQKYYLKDFDSSTNSSNSVDYHKKYREKEIYVSLNSRGLLRISVSLERGFTLEKRGLFIKKEVESYFPNENWKKFSDKLKHLAQKDGISIGGPYCEDLSIEYAFSL